MSVFGGPIWRLVVEVVVDGATLIGVEVDDRGAKADIWGDESAKRRRVERLVKDGIVLLSELSCGGVELRTRESGGRRIELSLLAIKKTFKVHDYLSPFDESMKSFYNQFYRDKIMYQKHTSSFHH